MHDVGNLAQASLEPPLHAFSASRRLAGEALGTALLLAMVVGSGIMGERLAGGNVAIALLGNTLSTGAGLVVAAAYVLAQVAGGVLGVWAAHAMFAEPIWQVSAKLRDVPPQAFAEFVATFGLIAAILGSILFRPQATPMIVGLYIASAYWFTASTSFANPAVTIARMLSNSFAGIAPSSAPVFILAQLAGAVAASVLFSWLLKERTTP